MFNLGTSEILLIAFLVFLLFGPKEMAGILRSIGKAIYDIQKTVRGIEEELWEQTSEETSQMSIKEGGSEK
ncbi:MAG: Sec-independent protein translocase subunit TatA/TatB [bacterium JZ-2024 1]